MESLTNIYEQIDRLQTSNMTAEERKAFVEKYKTEESFRKEVDFRLAAQQVLKEQATAKKAEMTAWFRETEKSVIFSQKIRYIAAAALVFLVLGVGIIQFIPKPSEKEAIAYFEPYSDQKMGGKEAKTEATDLLQGDDYFQQKKYTEAIKTWEKITKDSPFREIADFDIALAYVAQKDYKQAELYLKKIASEGGRGKKARELRRKLWLRF